jgi:hypothetical protein
MQIRERIISILLNVIIAGYGLLALQLIGQAIYNLRRKERNRRDSNRTTDESITDYRAALRKRGWLNTWLRQNIQSSDPSN